MIRRNAPVVRDERSEDWSYVRQRLGAERTESINDAAARVIRDPAAWLRARYVARLLLAGQTLRNDAAWRTIHKAARLLRMGEGGAS